MMTLRAAALICLLAALAGGPARAQPLKVVSEAVPPQPASIRFVIHSDRVGRNFQVTVTGPAASTFLPGQKLPAIYALDDGYDVAGAQGRFLGNFGAMAPAAVISIGYLPGEGRARLVDLAHQRWTPLGETAATGGGGAAFEAFLLQELKPFLEAKYPIDAKRSVLFGHSLGGLFAANVFAEHPDAFAGYIMASVSVWSQPDVVERVAAAAKRATGARVYLSVAEFDDTPGTIQMRPGFEAMARALSGRAGVTLKTRIYPGENHVSYYPQLVLDSFPFVLPGAWSRITSQAALPPGVSARYAGTYRMPDGREILIRATPQGQLTAVVAGGDAVPLLQNGRDRFYSPASDIDVQFDARGADLSGGGAKLRIEKAP